MRVTVPGNADRHPTEDMRKSRILRGAARRLFARLRELDAAGYRHLHLESAPGEDGYALAINDRLRRAAAR